MIVQKVTDNLYRGSHPETPEDFAYLKSIGITIDMNLETGIYAFITGRNNWENEQALANGIGMIQYPLSFITPATKKQVQFVMKMIEATRLQGGRMFLHCKDGEDRTGLMIGYERVIFEKWTKALAVTEIKNKGMHPWYYWWINSFMENLQECP